MLSNLEAFFIFILSIIFNYRPVSVLPVFSKNFEKVFETQLSDFFDTIFNPFCVLSDVDKDARPRCSDF
jgi:hypothetical protein